MFSVGTLTRKEVSKTKIIIQMWKMASVFNKFTTILLVLYIEFMLNDNAKGKKKCLLLLIVILMKIRGILARIRLQTCIYAMHLCVPVAFCYLR